MFEHLLVHSKKNKENIQEKDKVRKREHHSEKNVKNLALSPDIINQKLKYRVLSICLCCNEQFFLSRVLLAILSKLSA